MLDLKFPYISGYKPRSNYQKLLYDVVSEQLLSDRQLQDIAAADADRPIVTPEVEDVLGIITSPPSPQLQAPDQPRQCLPSTNSGIMVNYLEREARNRSLGAAGEAFALIYERARLIKLGKEDLAEKIEHTSKDRGDGAGFDILSFEETGAERLIEVKTTKYGRETPFFVSRNELAVSKETEDRYHLYRLFGFNAKPRLFTLAGALSTTCRLTPSSYLASVN